MSQPVIQIIPTSAYTDADATRYLSAIGFVLLTYDHLLTFGDEVQYVWRAKRSVAKYLFLVNRYVVWSVLFAVTFFINHFSGPPINSRACQIFFSFSSVTGVISVAFANVLVLLRLHALWDHNKKIQLYTTLGFCITFSASLCFIIVTITKLVPTIIFVPQVYTCTVTGSTRCFPAVWASSMVFEVFVLTALSLNALTKPRDTHTRLTRVLYYDGILFFLALTALRTFNLVLAIKAPPSLIMLGTFFVWSMTTLILNRSLLRIQKVKRPCSSTHVQSVGSIQTGIHSRNGLSLQAFNSTTFDLEGQIIQDHDSVRGFNETGGCDLDLDLEEEDESEGWRQQEEETMRRERAMKLREQLAKWSDQLLMKDDQRLGISW